MPEEKRLTCLGKLVVLAFIGGCLAAALWVWPGSPLRGILGNLSRSRPPGAGSGEVNAPSKGRAPGQRPAPARRANVWSEIQRRREVRIGYEADAPPMYFRNPRGEDDGFEYQLARRLAGEMGVPAVRFVAASYQDLPDRLRAGDLDLIVAGYVPDPSLEGVEWSDGYLDFGLCLIVLQSSAVTSVSQLAGKAVAVYDDPAAARWVRDHVPGAQVKTYSGESGWFEALERREVDALVYDYPFAAEEIKRHPRTKIVEFNLNQSRYAVGLPAGNDALLDAVNASLRRLVASAEYGELVRRYLSYRSDEMTRPIAGQKTYTVQAGDTLSRIAQAQLGSSDRWEEIWARNKDRVPNPHLIFPGMVLIMP